MKNIKKKKDYVGSIGLGIILLFLASMMTTCAFHNKLKYTNIKKVEIKMVVVNEIFKDEREGKTNVTNFYLRIKSPFLVTPRPDYLIKADNCSEARKGDTLVCLVKSSNTLRNAWYSSFAVLGDQGDDRFLENQNLFYIMGVTKVIKNH